ncbi:MAG: flagellar export chaperone FlgN [bacterium]
MGEAEGRAAEELLEELIRCLKDELSQYEAMAGLVAKARGFIEVLDMDGLGDLNLRESEVTASIAEIERRIKPLLRSLGDALGVEKVSLAKIGDAVGKEYARELGDLTDRISDSVQGILRAERENQILLQGKMVELRNDLRRLYSARKMNEAYNRAGEVPRGATFIDKMK